MGSLWTAASLTDAPVAQELRLSLGEGQTPLQPSASTSRILLKREDLNPTGSHKDRAAAYQLALARTEGRRAVVISSSGNAAIATSRYAQAHDLAAIVCVHPQTPRRKLSAIDGATTAVLVTERAINTAKRLALVFSLPNLRPSTSPTALAGYATIADELADESFDALVMFATSGATAVAVAQRLEQLGHPAQIHCGQQGGSSDAGALGVRNSRRAAQLQELMHTSGGTGWVVDEADVSSARAQLRSTEGIEPSDESCANFWIAQRLAQAGKTVVCLISGAPPETQGSGPAHLLAVADEWEAVQQVQELGFERTTPPTPRGSQVAG